MFLPWLFFKPLIHSVGEAGFFMLLLSTVLVPIAYRALARKMELRADRIASSNEPETGVYARALLRLYEDGLLPAVNAKDNATHPSLYDRLIAAGMNPDFPRPKPPSPISWNGMIFSGVLGLLAMILIIRLVGKS